MFIITITAVIIAIVALIIGVRAYSDSQQYDLDVLWPLLDTDTEKINMTTSTQNLNGIFKLLQPYNLSTDTDLSQPYRLIFYADSTSTSPKDQKPTVTIIRSSGNVNLVLTDNLVKGYGYETETTNGTAYQYSALYQYKQGDQIQFTNVNTSGSPIFALVDTPNDTTLVDIAFLLDGLSNTHNATLVRRPRINVPYSNVF